MSSPPGIAGVFDRAADTYDAVGVPWFGPIAEGLVEELAVRPGERVLDVGCGRGAALRPLAGAAGPTGHVLGVDLSPRMVALTAADVRDLPGVEVRVGDATALELPPASVDVVASCLVLFFLPDPVAAVASWVRLLDDGGRLGVTTFGRQDPRWRAVDALFTPYLPPAMTDARTTGARGPFASDEGVAALLTAAGLTDVQRRPGPSRSRSTARSSGTRSRGRTASGRCGRRCPLTCGTPCGTRPSRCFATPSRGPSASRSAAPSAAGPDPTAGLERPAVGSL